MDIVFIGAGNLATNLAKSLHDHGYKIKQVYSRTLRSAKELANMTDASYTSDIQDLVSEADLFILSVTDDAIKEILEKLMVKQGLIVHTAGSVPMNIFESYFEDFGVFYPLQTFNKQKEVDFSNVPVCLEANSEQNLKILDSIARSLTQQVYYLDTEQRLHIHIAAVFACNFTNFMFVSAENILQKQGIPFHILNSLIQETTQKIYDDIPSALQTGPAVRNDKKTVDKHLKLLSDAELFKNLYSFVSDAIRKYYNKETE